MGIPLLNAKYTIGELVHQFDSSGYMVIGSDGSLSFTYTYEKEKIIKASDFLKVDDQVFSNPYFINPNRIAHSTSIEHHNAPISFDNEFLKIVSANIKTGQIEINVTNNMEQDYYCILTTPNIKTAAGTNLSLTFAPNQLHHTLDLANYSIIPGENNTGEFDVEVGVINNGVTPTTDHYDLNVTITITNFTIRSVYAKVAPYSIAFNESFDFDLSSDQYGGDLTIYNPKLFISTKNSFMIDGNIQIDTAAFSGEGLYSSIITNPPVNVIIPISPQTYQTDEVNAFSSITVNTNYNKVHVSGAAVLNPDGFDAGVIRIDEFSDISLKIRAEIPIDIKINNIFYTDTIEFNLTELIKDIPTGNIDFLDTIALRSTFESTLPINVYAQAYFLDTTSHTIIDSLFASPKLLYASFNNFPTPSVPQMIQISGSRIENIKACDKIIFRFSLDTENREVAFKASQYLKATLGLKAVFDYNQISIK